MFDKLQQGKELIKMRQQAKALQKELEKIEHVEEGRGMKVKVNGTQNIVYVEIDGDQKEDLVDLINKAMKNVQKKSAKKMLEMGGGLSGFFGG